MPFYLETHEIEFIADIIRRFGHTRRAAALVRRYLAALEA